MFVPVPFLYALSRNFFTKSKRFSAVKHMAISHLKCGQGYFIRSSSNSVVFRWIFFWGGEGASGYQYPIQPEGQGYLPLPIDLLKTCPAWLVLSAAGLPPT